MKVQILELGFLTENSMYRLMRRIPMTLAALAMAICAHPLLAEGGVRDEAKVFSPETVAKANEMIRRMVTEHKKELLVETLAAIPSVEKGGPDLKNNAATKKWIQEYALGRAKSNSVDGVYLLLIQEPRKFQFEIGTKTQQKAFTIANRSEAEKKIIPLLKDNKMDEALLALVNFVQEKYTEHHQVAGNRNRGVQPVAAQQGENNPLLGYLCLGALVLGGIMLVMGLIRGFSGMGGGGGMGGPGYGGGGGGFFSNFLGGMFGAAAGMWMYDSFFGHGGSHAWGAGNDNSSTLGGSGNDRDTDYTGSGGDWGGGGSDSSSSGGDWGGGGGDFGGGGGGGDY